MDQHWNAVWYYFTVVLTNTEIMRSATVLIAAFALSLSTAALAQDEVKKDVKKAGRTVKRGAKKAGNKTAELAVKAESKVMDEEVKGKMGPNGEKVYVKDGNKYYWVDSKGRKQYLAEAQLRNR